MPLQLESITIHDDTPLGPVRGFTRVRVPSRRRVGLRGFERDLIPVTDRIVHDLEPSYYDAFIVYLKQRARRQRGPFRFRWPVDTGLSRDSFVRGANHAGYQLFSTTYAPYVDRRYREPPGFHGRGIIQREWRRWDPSTTYIPPGFVRGVRTP